MVTMLRPPSFMYNLYTISHFIRELSAAREGYTEAKGREHAARVMVAVVDAGLVAGTNSSMPLACS